MGPLNSPFPGTLSPIPPQPVNMIQQPSTSLHTTNGTDPAHQPPDLQHSHTPSTSTSPIREAMPQALSISVPAASGSQGRPPIGTTSSVPEQPLAQPTIQFGRGFSTLEDHGSQSARARVPVIVRTFFNREGRERRHIARIIFQPAFTLTQVVAIIVVLALAGSKFRSKSDPTISELGDCKNLGIWNALWAVKAAFGCYMICWERRRGLAPGRDKSMDIELAGIPRISPLDPLHQDLRRGTEVRGPLDTRADALFDRVEIFLTATGLIHFVGNQIWLYKTVRTCRVNDPHVWYLGLSIASLCYMVVLELLWIAFVVFVLGPILPLIHNLVMLPTEIPKIEQSLIDKIPLVIFIPPIDAEIKGLEEQGTAAEPRDSSGSRAAASEPMTSQSSASRTPRFAWFRRRLGKGKAPQPTIWSDAKLVTDGDPRYEKADHSFVVLESNRASCPICLIEFVEPKRKEGVPLAPPRPKAPESTAVAAEGPSSASPVEEGIEREAGDGDATPSKEKKAIEEHVVQTAPEAEEEAGTPGEALRLLACGHVFHIHCLDPWLSRTSGRCPVCNRKVEIPERMK